MGDLGQRPPKETLPGSGVRGLAAWSCQNPNEGRDKPDQGIQNASPRAGVASTARGEALRVKNSPSCVEPNIYESVT
jgi:hypothetical protein